MTALFVPLDGRLTSQNVLTGPLTGGEVMYIVSPGNADKGNSYQVTTQTLSGFFQGFGVITEVTFGATSGSPYPVLTNQSRVLFDKTSGSASYALCPLSATITTQDILFKDLKGDANTNNITIEFTSGETCDGLSSLVVNNNYGWVKIAPIPGGGGWYQL
jgi:hypothetical protein